jgi:hypothetical protein
MFLVVGRGRKHLIRYFGVQNRIALTQDLRQAARRVYVNGVTLAQLPGNGHLRGIDVLDSETLHATIRLQNVDRAPIREFGHSESRNVPQGRAVIE